jgi:PAS domain S-box-containing protein
MHYILLALFLITSLLYLKERQHRKSLKEKLRLNNKNRNIEELFKQSSAALFTMDAEARFQSVNPLASAIMGHPANYIIGKKESEIFPPGIGDVLEEISTNVIKNNKAFNAKEELVSEGEPRVHHTLKFPIHDDDGTVVALGAISYDITEKTQIENELKRHKNELEQLIQERTEQLELARQESEQNEHLAIEASKAKSQFLATVSHEIRTPMNAIIGITELLSDTTLDSQQKDFVGTIQTSSQALLNLINEILDFSKADACKLSLFEEQFDIRQLLEEVADLLFTQAHNKALRFNLFIPNGLNTNFTGDRKRLRQVLINLAGNAIKFTPQGEVSIRCQLTNQNNQNQRLEISISDTGIGINEEDITLVFQPFKQLDSQFSREHEGTGLGLTICQQLVELMGGEISCESQKGKGSCFTIKLPYNVDKENQHQLGAHFSNTKILIADTHSGSRELLKDYLGNWGADVTLLDCHEAVIHLIKQTPQDYDLAIIDQSIRSPEAAQALKQLRQTPGLKTKLLACKAPGNLLEKIDTRDIFDDCINRPIKIAELYQAIDRLLHNTTSSPHQQSPNIAPPHFGLKVLITEDNPVNRKVASLMLKKLGCQITTVYNGQKALEAIQSGHYDIILMDCQMPVMDGLEATRQIRELNLKEQPWIIAATANVSDDDRTSCFQAGMNDYISKPISLQHLQEGLEKYQKTRRVN